MGFFLRVNIQFLFVLGVVSSTFSAEKDATKRITYQNHIKPILRKHCFACHNANQAKSDLDLTQYRTAMAGGSSGEVLVSGDTSRSRLYLLVTHAEKPTMPPKRPRLPDAQLKLIKQWIETGLLETPTGRPKRSKQTSVLALRLAPPAKPSGPPPMPNQLPLEPLNRTDRANAVIALASSPWAPIVAVGSQKQVLIYHTDTQKLAGVLPFGEGLPYVLRFSRDGRLLLAGGGRGGDSGCVVVWDITTGKRLLKVGDELDIVLAADISPDRSQIALGGADDHLVTIYSAQNGKQLRQLKKHSDWILALEFSPNGQLLATGDRSGGVSVWETKTGSEVFNLRGHRKAITALSWRSDSLVLASSSEDGTIKLWDCRDGKLAKGWTAHATGVLGVRFARDGQIGSCGRDRVARVWDQNGAERRKFERLADVATRVAFHHDASRLIVGDWTGEVRVWTIEDGKQVGRLSSNVPTVLQLRGD